MSSDEALEAPRPPIDTNPFELAVIAGLAAAATLQFSASFGSWNFLRFSLAGAALAALVAWIGRRLGLLAGESLLGSLLIFFVFGTAWTQNTIVPDAFSSFSRSLVGGWAELLANPPPVPLSPTMAVLPFSLSWWAVMIGAEVTRRIKLPGFASVGAFAALAVTSLINPENKGIVVLQGLAVVVQIFVLTQLAAGSSRRHTQHDEGSNQLNLKAMGSVVLAILCASVLAGTVVPRLAWVEETERFDLRSLQRRPWDPLDQPSPLVAIKADLKKTVPDLTLPDAATLDATAERLLFRVEAESPATRWTSAILTDYSGVVWHVADGADPVASFVPFEGQLPETVEPLAALPLSPTRVAIEVVDAEGSWIPTPGNLRSLTFESRTDARVNLATGTIAVPDGLRPGLAFEALVEPRRELDPEEISNVDLAASTAATDLELLSDPLVNLVAELVEGVDSGGAQVAAIQRQFTQEGFYDVSSAVSPGHTYAHIGSFVQNPNRLVGYEEIYTATAAVALRIADIPSRVAVGYVIEPERFVGGSADIYSSDATAWVEVKVAGQGWVALNVTPDESRVPSPEPESPAASERVSPPNDPPAPPPPIESDLEPDEEQEPEPTPTPELDDESSPTSRGGRRIQIAGSVAAIPFVVFGSAAIAVVVLKARRTKRRQSAPTSAGRVVGAWDDTHDLYAEGGFVPALSATPEETVEFWVAADAPAASDRKADLLTLAELATQGAFGRGGLDDHAADYAWQQAELVKAAVADTRSPVEKVLARANPSTLSLHREAK